MRRIVKLLGLGGWLALPANPAPAQVIDILHSFNGGANDGRSPQGSLTLLGSTLFGMTQGGGTASEGTIFKMSVNGSGFDLLRSFAIGVSDGHQPSGSLIVSGSALFGMTLSGGGANEGAIIRVGTDGSGYALTHSFGGGPADGAAPFGSLVQSGGTSTALRVPVAVSSTPSAAIIRTERFSK
jgi:uncharacterized repeat protein (TIGR03803 family)